MSKKSLLCAAAALATAVAVGFTTLLPQPGQAQEEVTYLLPALPSLPAFGPWMLAQYRGYYADEGLNVTFQSGKGGVDVAKQVGVGNATIGGAIGDTPIIVRANGIPVKAVALLGAGALTQLVVPEDSSIQGPADLKGHKISVMAYQDTTFYSLLGMLASAGLGQSDVDALAAGPANVWKLFMAGEVDAMAAVPDWIGLVQANNVKVRIIPSDDYFPSMAQAILASDEVIVENPELIRKLVQATLKGLRDIIADPKAAAADYVKAVPEHQGKEATIENIFRLYVQYVYKDQPVPGAMDEERLSKVQDFYLKQGIIRKASALDELYTNEFVK
jgi:NitT/TauT family transport system substrate-binding protein